ncbi:DUF3131 domain-containing protein [Sulfitobacter sp. MF3-043]|uniref:DUF3131 domain-containing protein n=1 Tax=Sulfitobacter sediminivivens TaxID=3252902 RepID=UPI0036DE634E
MISRRTFLKWGSASPILLTASGEAIGATSLTQNTVLVMDGVGPDTDAERLAIVLNTFAKAGVPLTCLIEVPKNKTGRLHSQGLVASALRTHLQTLPGLFEVVPVAKDLATLNPYFQARAAHQARIDLATSIWGDGAGIANVMHLRTIACDMATDPLAPSGIRAGGFRNVLMRPSETQEVRPEAWDDGVLRMIGGRRVTLGRARGNVGTAQPRRVEQVLYLSAKDFANLSIANLEAAATQFALDVQTSDGADWSTPILGSDLQFRDAYGYRRNIGLHFVLGENANAEDQEILAGFRQELAAAGLASSFGAPAIGHAAKDGQATYWIDVQGPTISDRPDLPLQLLEVSDPVARPTKTTPVPETYGLGVALIDWNDPSNTGLGAQGELRVPAFLLDDPASISDLRKVDLGTGDFVIVVSNAALRTRAQRNMIKSTLLNLSQDGITSSVSLPDYVRAIVPKGAYISHFRRTVAYAAAGQPRQRTLSTKAIDAYLQDAKTAWRYFDQWTNRKTGLCPATISSPEGEPILHEAVTMWDVGSQINALIAAVDIGLITARQFQAAIKKILPNIAGRRSQGRLLPQGWIATDRFKWGTKNFDGCDAGRLMAALYNLDSHGLAQDKSAPIVKKWDLREIIKDGVINSVQGGELESTFRSHCAHYATWAFRTWGIEALSPYEVFVGNTVADGKMRLLEVAGNIGPMGAEPLLLEAIELGMSPESSYLADVLFAAQLEEYDQTGQFTCVSEGPLDRPPWFTYQGLQFDAPGRVWATDTVAGLPAHRSPEFREKNAVVSSKGAYLWAAYKNHDYCDALVEYVRSKAQTPYGFCSSIYRNTGQATSNYADINTNAIILQSIARILKTAEGL